MKYLGVLSLAAIMAISLTAFAGGSAAQANLYTDGFKTVKYPTGTTIDLSLKWGTSLTLKNTSGTTVATCTESTMKGKTSNESGAGIAVNLETLGWSSCSQAINTTALGHVEIKWTSGSSGEIIGIGSRWTLTLVSGTSCVYGFGEGTKLGEITGQEAPVLSINATTLKVEGGAECPSSTVLGAEYVVTEPHALYIGRALTTSLYTDSAKTVKYSTGTTIDLSLKPGTSTTLTDTSGTMIATCTESTTKGKTSNESGEVVSMKIETQTWGGCSQTTDTSAPGKLAIKWTSGTSGEVISRESQWTFGIFGVSCTYGTGAGEGISIGTISGGEAPELSINAVVSKTAGSFLCPGDAVWAGKYVFTEPHALFVGS